MTSRHRTLATVALLLLGVAQGCGGETDRGAATNTAPKPKAGRAAEQAKENSGRVRDIQAKCSETSDEGKAVIETVKAWKPVVNERPSDKPLAEIAAEYVSKGLYEICWGASKKTNGRWKVVYNHIDIRGSFQEAEWEHDPATGETKPFNAKAMEFWYGKL